MLPIGERTLIMGIVNVTSDSFYDGGKYNDPDKACEHARLLVTQGADIIDIGGESSRPGSKRCSTETELQRVIPVIKKLSSSIKVPISIDTTKAEVARQALDNGANIINDISACRFEPQIVKIAVTYNAPLILMHMQGTPQDMQGNPCYHDVVAEIKKFLNERINWTISNGVQKENIIIDPGIGFGKLPEHNLEILRKLKEFTELGYPLLVGPSRKSFIGSILGTQPKNRLWGTAAAVTMSVVNQANIIRVHDVLEMSQVIKVTEAIKNKPIVAM